MLYLGGNRTLPDHSDLCNWTNLDPAEPFVCVCQVDELTSQLAMTRTDNEELQAKLARLAEEQRAERSQAREVSSALEIARVQLIQLRGGGGAGQQEIQNLSGELQTTRKSLTEALGRYMYLY
jgi:hypothetical protein